MSHSEHDVYVKQLLADIDAYMTFLTSEQGLYVSVHQLDLLVNAFQINLQPYNCHLVPYCRQIKSNKAIYDECVLRQRRLFSRLGDKPFFGTCWAGVGEYVFPIPNRRGEGKGFVSVSGYKGDPVKSRRQMLKISTKYDVPYADLYNLYSVLRDDRPSLEEVSRLVKPLVHMLTLLLNTLYDMSSHFPQEKTSSGYLYTAICSMLHNEYSTHYSLEDIAGRFNCSVSHVSHLFSKYARCSYRTYVNSMRINIAKLLLTSTHMNVQEISDHLGYVNSNYFSTVFRRMCGLSPREYRARG